MAVNSNTDVQATTDDILKIPSSLFSKLSNNQKKLIQTLAENHPHGLLSSELTHELGVSNKSDLIHFKLRMLLANEGLEINITRVSKQWLWLLRPIKDMELTEQKE